MTVTTDLVTAHHLCPRKAFLILRGDPVEKTHEYITVLNQNASQSRDRFVSSLGSEAHRTDDGDGLGGHAPANSRVLISDFASDTQVLLLRRTAGTSKSAMPCEPHLFIGTSSARTEDRLRLAFIGKVVAETRNDSCPAGVIITPHGKSLRVPFEPLASRLTLILNELREWVLKLPDEPPVILNDHCPLCEFRSQCLRKAEQEDSITLLDRMTPKLLKRYQKKGIFTINQLSYLFRPRKTRRRGPKAPTTFKLELQALALRTGMTYFTTPLPCRRTTLRFILISKDFQTATSSTLQAFSFVSARLLRLIHSGPTRQMMRAASSRVS